MSRIAQAWVKPTLESRIGAHVHVWEQARQLGRLPVAAPVLPFVTISREFGCEGLPLALRLAEIFNARSQAAVPWVAYDHEVLDKVAQELHLHRSVVESIDGRRRSEMSELFDSILNKKMDDTLVFRKLAEVVRSLAIHGHAILLGRGCFLITQDLKTALHVRLVAPRDWRVYKVVSTHGMTQREATEWVVRRERERDQFVKTFFVQDPEHPFIHDLVIDNARFNLDQIVEIICCALTVRFGAQFVGT